MTILVDPADKYSDDNLRKAVRWLKWSHMVSDESLDELHQFALLRLGLRPSWHHNGCYYLTVKKRRAAVAAGAVEVSARELVKRNCVGVLRRKQLVKTVEERLDKLKPTQEDFRKVMR